MFAAPPPCRKEWTLLRDDSIFVDWQRLKVQENVEEVRRWWGVWVGSCVWGAAASRHGGVQWCPRGCVSWDGESSAETAQQDDGVGGASQQQQQQVLHIHSIGVHPAS